MGKEKTAMQILIDKLPSNETIEKNGKEGGLRDNELQMFFEGAVFLRSLIKSNLTKYLELEKQQMYEAWCEKQDYFGDICKEKFNEYFSTKYGTNTNGL